jgi:hypothetical protein
MRPILILMSVSLCPAVLAADSAPVPFYYSGATIVEPQISTLIVGVDQSIAQASVSPDRKYVTLNMDTNLLSNQGIRTFTYQGSHLGFVGTAAASGDSILSNSVQSPGNNLTPSIKTLPGEIAPTLSPLLTPGVTRIAGLGNSPR